MVPALALVPQLWPQQHTCVCAIPGLSSFPCSAPCLGPSVVTAISCLMNFQRDQNPKIAKMGQLWLRLIRLLPIISGHISAHDFPTGYLQCPCFKHIEKIRRATNVHLVGSESLGNCHSTNIRPLQLICQDSVQIGHWTDSRFNGPKQRGLATWMRFWLWTFKGRGDASIQA